MDIAANTNPFLAALMSGKNEFQSLGTGLKSIFADDEEKKLLEKKHNKREEAISYLRDQHPFMTLIGAFQPYLAPWNTAAGVIGIRFFNDSSSSTSRRCFH